MENTSLKGKRVLIFQQRGWGVNIGHFLAKKLQAEGAILAALTFKKTAHQFVIDQKEVKYETIVNLDEIKSRPKKYLAGEYYPLSEICLALGVDSIWPLVAGLRNHVRSYGEKYYYSFKQNVPDEGIIDYVMALYKMIRRLFQEFKPDIIIAPNFGLPHIMMNLMGKKAGIPMIVLFDSKISRNYIFSTSYKYDRGSFHDQLEALNGKTVKSANWEKAKSYIADFRKNFKLPEGFDWQNPGSKDRTPWQRIRHFFSPFYQILKWYAEPQLNYWESIGVSVDYRPPRIILRDHFSYDRYLKFAKNYKYYPLEKIARYAYFPLQFQPEESIDIGAPFFSNQIETARQIAMALPDDYTLAVKEHPAMVGLRPPSYLQKIDRTPNVKLIDYRTPSKEVLRKAAIVICPTGTTIAEAAFFKKPVIQLGELGTTLKLPNVFKHTDMTTLAAKIKEVLTKNLDTEEYERRLQNYVAAGYDSGLEINYSTMWERGIEKERLDDLWLFYRKEIERVLFK
jgi:hypothetical protein